MSILNDSKLDDFIGVAGAAGVIARHWKKPKMDNETFVSDYLKIPKEEIIYKKWLMNYKEVEDYNIGIYKIQRSSFNEDWNIFKAGHINTVFTSISLHDCLDYIKQDKKELNDIREKCRDRIERERLNLSYAYLKEEETE